ncbi:ATP-grasp domain-containing protein [bacterium]|nr:ATP-grasp domain-containing protein [bacterium]
MRVLVLGARVYQLPLIRRAKEMGHTVYAASYDANDPGLKLADHAWIVDTTAKEELLELAEKNKIDFAITTGTDVALPAIGYINDRLGLPGISYQTALASTDKVLMQQKFKEYGVASARSVSISSFDEGISILHDIGLPAIVKAPDSSGSRGITVVQEEKGFLSAYDEAARVSRSGKVLLEELLVGEEFGAQAIVKDGKVVQVYCHNDTVTPPPITVPIGHSVPSNFSEVDLAEIRIVLGKAVRALDINSAVCNCDLIQTKDGPKVLEIGARLGATGIAEIILHHYGVDLWLTALELLGKDGLSSDFPISSNNDPVAALLLLSDSNGSLAKYEVPDEIKDNEDVLIIELDKNPGADINKFKVGPDRIGMVVVKNKTVLLAERFAESVAHSISVRVE